MDESSLLLRTANFPSLKGAVNSSSRKILREVLANLYIWRVSPWNTIGNIPQSKMSAIPDAANRFTECVTTEGIG